MKKVSLDEYRSDGVSVFSGEKRGKRVAEEIKKEFGIKKIQLVIPPDVFYIDRSFKRGFNKILPQVKMPQNPNH